LVRLSDKRSELLSRFYYVFLDEIHSGLQIKGTVNNAMVKYRHSIPRLDNILNELYGSCVFKKIDLQIGYHQIKMKERDREKNNFKTKCELFEWLIMLFSLIIAHNNLMRLKNHVLCAFIGNFVSDYFDDIHSKNLGIYCLICYKRYHYVLIC